MGAPFSGTPTESQLADLKDSVLNIHTPMKHAAEPQARDSCTQGRLSPTRGARLWGAATSSASKSEPSVIRTKVKQRMTTPKAALKGQTYFAWRRSSTPTCILASLRLSC